ncbi:hypothetical protein LCGC14_1278550 [marine sediment metagenome]|uniref:Uncharacterized protein n=1 Tax=marine sediment metagenome TaxID=412755 RepID=A0A0F9KVV8_9ZZZZ
MSKAQKKTKKYKRIVYCERCNHPEDRHTRPGTDDETACAAKTVKTGAPVCKCPKFVRPTGGAMASIAQRLTLEKGRSGELPPPFEADDRPPRR